MDTIYSTVRAFAAKLTNGHMVTWGDAGQGGDSSSVQAELTMDAKQSNVDIVTAELGERFTLQEMKVECKRRGLHCYSLDVCPEGAKCYFIPCPLLHPVSRKLSRFHKKRVALLHYW